MDILASKVTELSLECLTLRNEVQVILSKDRRETFIKHSASPQNIQHIPLASKITQPIIRLILI